MTTTTKLNRTGEGTMEEQVAGLIGKYGLASVIEAARQECFHLRDTAETVSDKADAEVGIEALGDAWERIQGG